MYSSHKLTSTNTPDLTSSVYTLMAWISTSLPAIVG
jgi:hypothetical protein